MTFLWKLRTVPTVMEGSKQLGFQSIPLRKKLFLSEAVLDEIKPAFREKVAFENSAKAINCYFLQLSDSKDFDGTLKFFFSSLFSSTRKKLSIDS